MTGSKLETHARSHRSSLRGFQGRNAPAELVFDAKDFGDSYQRLGDDPAKLVNLR